MSDGKVHDLFMKTAEVYYYGDYLTGDVLLSQCLVLYSKMFELNAERRALFHQFEAIKIARKNQDFTAIADMLRFEIAPKLAPTS